MVAKSSLDHVPMTMFLLMFHLNHEGISTPMRGPDRRTPTSSPKGQSDSNEAQPVSSMPETQIQQQTRFVVFGYPNPTHVLV